MCIRDSESPLRCDANLSEVIINPRPRMCSISPARIAAMTQPATFESLNPSTGEVIDSFPRSTAADVDRAVATARAAWEDWRLVPAPERGNILFRFAQLLEAHKPE